MRLEESQGAARPGENGWLEKLRRKKRGMME